MQALSLVLISLLAVVVSGFVARATWLPLPFVQMALGAALHAISPVPVVLDPQLFFLLFLPPLLFLDGWRIPNDELRREAGSIARLALGLVLFTVLGMGWFIHLLIPTLPLPVAFALAAVISPTDPTAVSSLAGRTPLPRRLMRILQGEALLNDASGLVCMRVAVGVVLTGSFSLPLALADFTRAALGGLAIGVALTWAVARAMSWASQRFGDDGVAPILATLLLPFGVYLLAEHWHCSGILAAVAAGLTISVGRLWHWGAATRLRRTAVWDLVQLATNGSIFVLLGEQLPSLLSSATETARAQGYAHALELLPLMLALVLVLTLLRGVWVWASLSLARSAAAVRARWQPGRARTPAPAVPIGLVLAATLGGVRGAVTLAGVMTLPLTLNNGQPFPGRDLAVLLAAGVIVLTLALATLGLPAALRHLQGQAEPVDRLAEDAARHAGATAALRALADEAAPNAPGADQRHVAAVARRLESLYRQRLRRHSSKRSVRLRSHDDEVERRLRLAALQAERQAYDRCARDGELDDDTLRRLVRELDLQETRHQA